MAGADGAGGGLGAELLEAGEGVLELGGGHEAAPGAQAAQPLPGALGPFVQVLARDAPGADRGEHRVVRLAEHLLVVAAQRGAQAQQIRARLEGAHGRLPVAGALGDRGHVERVGDDQAVEVAAHGPVQQRAGPGRDGGGPLPQGGHEHVSGHHRVEPGRDPPRSEVLALELGGVEVDPGQGGVGVGGGRAVAREVLRAGAQARLDQPGRDGAGVQGDPVRLVPEGARADHGVRRVGGDVEHRGEVEVDVAGAQQVSERPPGAAAQVGVADLAESPGGGQGGAGRGLQAGDVPALLVDRDHAVLGPRVDGAGEVAGRPRIRGVVPEEDHRGEAAVEGLLEEGRHGGAGEGGHEHAEHVGVMDGAAVMGGCGIVGGLRHASALHSAGGDAGGGARPPGAPSRTS